MSGLLSLVLVFAVDLRVVVFVVILLVFVFVVFLVCAVLLEFDRWTAFSGSL